MKRRALLSVSDKKGIVEFARKLIQHDFEILSTGGTKKTLEKEGIPVTSVEEITNFPEILEGRVKTLHPKIHGGLLARLGLKSHQEELQKHGIIPISILCVNLYPFQEVRAKKDASEEEVIENIDIGGPTMLRAAAKNHEYVTSIVDHKDYELVLEELQSHGEVTLATRRKFAAKVFRHTAAYDALIAEYMTELVGDVFPEKLTRTYELKQNLRYGENPHQKASFYRRAFGSPYSIANAKQLQGKELSFNNIQDGDAALQIVKEFHEPTVVAVKHMNPCGVGMGDNIQDAFTKAFAADPVSIFGGILACNREVNEESALKMVEIFLEIIIAPSFSKEALEILKRKKNLRLLKLPFEREGEIEKTSKSIEGGMLLQDNDTYSLEDATLTVPTERQPTNEEWAALKFGWKVVKHVKSNGIVVSNSYMTLGIGAGQMNRVGAAAIALQQAKEKGTGAVLASDAFFPMPDTVELAGKAGITAIIQPGGSIRDDECIEMANQYGIAMVLTGVRHFKH